MYGMHHHCYRRGGSRLVWFIIGGVSTAWWMRAREHHAAYHQHQQIGCTWKHRRELEAPHPGVEPADAQRPFFESWGFHAPRPGPAAVSPQGAAPASAQVPMSAPVPTPGQQPAHGMSWEEVQKERWADEQRARVAAAQQWEDEKEQLRSFAKQAETKVTDFSESTLDHIMSTAQALKGKLAERRAQQEQQRIREQQIAEEQRRSPNRWV